MKELLSIDSLTDSDIQVIFEKASYFHKSFSQHSNQFNSVLKNKKLCFFFLENSTRTKLSFEAAAKNLGIHCVIFQTNYSSLNKGESLIDTIKTLNAYDYDAYIMRTPHAGTPWILRQHTQIPIINAGDGCHEHPTQALLDSFSLLQKWGSLKGKRICLLGDVTHSRVAGSNIRLLGRLGAKVILSGPPSMLPRELPDEWKEKWGVEVSYQIEKAIEGVDAIMTWRLQKERMLDYSIPSLEDYARAWKITQKHIDSLCPDAWILHPGPANRGVEIDSQVLDSDRCLASVQVRNGVFIRMAVLNLILNEDQTRNQN